MEDNIKIFKYEYEGEHGYLYAVRNLYISLMVFMKWLVHYYIDDVHIMNGRILECAALI